MIMYRVSFPDVTRMKNVKMLIFNTPAATVKGSPMTGAQANNRLNTPYFLNLCFALRNASSEILENFFMRNKLPQ